MAALKIYDPKATPKPVEWALALLEDQKPGYTTLAVVDECTGKALPGGILLHLNNETGRYIRGEKVDPKFGFELNSKGQVKISGVDDKC